MSYQTQDSFWAPSAMVVGRCATGGGLWAMTDEPFTSKVFPSEKAAMAADVALAEHNRRV